MLRLLRLLFHGIDLIAGGNGLVAREYLPGRSADCIRGQGRLTTPRPRGPPMALNTMTLG